MYLQKTMILANLVRYAVFPHRTVIIAWMAFSKCEKIEVGLHDGHNDARLLSSGQQATSHKIIAKFQCPYIFRERKIKVGNCAVPRNSIQVTAAASTENSCPRISSKAEIVLRADHLTTKTKMRAAARRPVFKFDVAHFAHSPDPHTKIHICMSFLSAARTAHVFWAQQKWVHRSKMTPACVYVYI